MNFKKILAISIIVLAVLCCLSVASAGLFDSQEKAPAQPHKKMIDLNKTDAHLDVEQATVPGQLTRLEIHDERAQIGNSTNVNANITFTATSDISSLNDSDKKVLEGFQNGSYSADVILENSSSNLNVDNARFTIEGDTLTITGSQQRNNVMSGELPSSDVVITQVSVDHNNTMITIK